MATAFPPAVPTALPTSPANNAPWIVQIPHENNTDELQHLIAPIWVDTPNIRSTLDILQSCVLTLVACIYTALHLDVPIKTKARHLLLSKLKWVAITLFAPEVSIYMAADQLHQAWKLKIALRKEYRKQNPVGETGTSGDEKFIDLRYAYFIIMGGVRVDVHDMISTDDLDDGARTHFKGDWHTLRLSPKTVLELAKKGHWISVSKKTIDDKSKADTLQKALVLIQVGWMFVQVIVRQIKGLPISLLEIHTFVHVVCAVILYACWFRKPLNVQEPLMVQFGEDEGDESFKGEIAIRIQRQFYSNMRDRLALFPPERDFDEPAPGPPEGFPGRLRWVVPNPGIELQPGDILVSGLAYCPKEDDYPMKVQEELIRRWGVILSAFNLADLRDQNPEAKGPDVTVGEIGEYDGEYPTPGAAPRASNGEHDAQGVYLDRMQAFKPDDHMTFRNMPFCEGKRNLDINIKALVWGTWGIDFTQDLLFAPFDFFANFPGLAVLAVALSGIYGGVHLTSWSWVFPTMMEKMVWRVSCFYIMGALPVYMIIFGIFLAVITWMDDDVVLDRIVTIVQGIMLISGILYLLARVYIITEAFISLRHVPIGVYVAPLWVEMIPHF